jgi:hypothetical protein
VQTRTGQEEGEGLGLRKWTEERGLEEGELGERRMDGGEEGWVVGVGREGNRNGDRRGKGSGNRDRRGKGNRNSGGRAGRAAPFRGQGREGVRRKMGGFKAVDRKGIRTGTTQRNQENGKGPE